MTMVVMMVCSTPLANNQAMHVLVVVVMMNRVTFCDNQDADADDESWLLIYGHIPSDALLDV